MSDTPAGFPHSEPRETLTKIDPPPGLSKPTTQQVGHYTSLWGGAVCDYTSLWGGAVCDYTSLWGGAVCDYTSLWGGAVCDYTSV